MSEAMTAPSADEMDRAFEDAFRDLTAPGEERPANEPVEAAEQPAEGEEQPAEQPAEGEEQPAEQPAEGEEQPAEGEEQPAEGEEQPAKGESKDEDTELLARLGALLKKTSPLPDSTTRSEPAATTPEAPAQQEIYSDEDKKFLAEYAKEWPDVARGEALARRGEYVNLVNYVFGELGKYLGPLLQQVDTLAAQSQLASLRTQVTDYDQVRDQVVAWVETQPEYLKPAYEHVINRGTTEEVADLISRWRADTAAVAPKPAATRKPEPPLPPAAKQAAASMAPVGSKRSAATAGVDPMDFDAAFAVATKNS